MAGDRQFAVHGEVVMAEVSRSKKSDFVSRRLSERRVDNSRATGYLLSSERAGVYMLKKTIFDNVHVGLLVGSTGQIK